MWGVSRYKDILLELPAMGYIFTFFLSLFWASALGSATYSEQNKRVSIALLLAGFLVAQTLVVLELNQRFVLLFASSLLLLAAAGNKKYRIVNTIISCGLIGHFFFGKGSLLPSGFESESVYSETKVTKEQIYQYRELNGFQRLITRDDRVILRQSTQESRSVSEALCAAIDFGVLNSYQLDGEIIFINSFKWDLYSCLKKGLVQSKKRIHLWEPEEFIRTKSIDHVFSFYGDGIKFLSQSEFESLAYDESSIVIFAPDRFSQLDSSLLNHLLKYGRRSLSVIFSQGEVLPGVSGIEISNGLKVYYLGRRSEGYRRDANFIKDRSNEYQQVYKKLELESS
jgi:hypothetical protein